MPMPYDAIMKDLLERSPSDWVALVGHPGLAAELIDADVSTVTAASDKLIRVGDKPEWLLDLNFQRGPDQRVPERLHLYATVLKYRHRLPVRSVVILLSPKANLSNLTEVYEEAFPGQPPYLTFRYKVIRVWQLPPAVLLASGLSLLPLVLISAAAEEELPGLARQMKERLEAEAESAQREELWTAAYILMGLRYNDAVVERVMKEVVTMEESSTYQAIIRRGRIREDQELLLLLGEAHLGAASPTIRQRVEGMGDHAYLRRLLMRVHQAPSWDELLALPPE